MFVERRRREDPFLEWKVRLFSVAAVLVLVGLYLDERRITGAAILVLAVALLLRFLPGGSAAGVGSDEGEGKSDGEASDPTGTAEGSDATG
ncbi:MAG: hypothetical protein R3304_11685 [Longimicrobiales bacterium]|nr:hypothetical protein [Longimicrobiales bacterium]